MGKEFLMSKEAPIVETVQGRLRGFRYDGVDHFYGIRYARAERFQMPEPVPHWDGIKDAVSYGMICPVLNEPQPAGEVMMPHRFWPTSEHCQYLNVWTASCDPEARRPVMFWIHGGGYASGSSIEQVCYDGFNLARLDDVVVVSVNHRLNAFGYMDLSAYGEKYWNSVNVGMADLVEALRWVRDNIAAFGGDPENVTIFGQSGGGGKVTVLGQIPEAEGLFHKMIVMSGVIGNGILDPVDDMSDFVGEVLRNLHIPEQEVERLEKVPVPQFIWAVNKASATWAAQGRPPINWAPKPNRYYTCDPLIGDFSDYARKIPTMVGSVLAEFAFMTPDLGERDALSVEQREAVVRERFGAEGGDKILAEFRRQYPQINEVYAIDMDTMFLPPTVAYVKKKAAEASAPVYNYIYAQVYDYDGGRAAWHCSDIPYFFHNAELIPICHQPGYEQLDQMMSSAFVRFARTGNPNGAPGLPQWDACTDGSMVTMVLGNEPYSAVNMQDELLSLYQQYQPQVSFDIPQAAGDDEEESGSAWVY